MDERTYIKSVLASIGFLVVVMSGLSQAASAAIIKPDTSNQVRLESFGEIPLCFIVNQGQADPRVGCYVQGRETYVYFTSEGLTFVLSASGTEGDGPAPVSFSGRAAGGGREGWKSATLGDEA